MSGFSIGQVIGGRYRLDAELARGGMGAVYRATDSRIGRTVAIKVLLAELATEATIVARFQREATAVASLHHPGIVQVLDLGQEAGAPFLVMEHIAGRTIGDVLAKEGKLDPARAADIAEQALFALSVAHGAGIVHRDLKPGNVMLAPTGGRDAVKVLDFGVAQLKHGAAYTRLTQTGAIVGTPAYMAPEQAHGRPCDGRTDVYAMGVLLWCMLTGKKPFTGRDMAEVLAKVLGEVPTRADRVEPSVPAALAAVCEVALQKQPENRFASASAFATALVQLRSRPPATSVMPSQPGASPATRPMESRQASTLLTPDGSTVPPHLAGQPRVTVPPRVSAPPPQMPAPLPMSSPLPMSPSGRVSAPPPVASLPPTSVPFAPERVSSPGPMPFAPAVAVGAPPAPFAVPPTAALPWTTRRLVVAGLGVAIVTGLITCAGSAFVFQRFATGGVVAPSQSSGNAGGGVCPRAVRCCEVASRGAPGCEQLHYYETMGAHGESLCAQLLSSYEQSANIQGLRCD